MRENTIKWLNENSNKLISEIQLASNLDKLNELESKLRVWPEEFKYLETLFTEKYNKPPCLKIQEQEALQYSPKH